MASSRLCRSRLYGNSHPGFAGVAIRLYGFIKICAKSESLPKIMSSRRRLRYSLSFKRLREFVELLLILGIVRFAEQSHVFGFALGLQFCGFGSAFETMMFTCLSTSLRMSDAS